MADRCNGKKIYTSQKAAKKVLRTRGHAVSYLRVYPCDYCYGWHLTSMERGESDTWQHR